MAVSLLFEVLLPSTSVVFEPQFQHGNIAESRQSQFVPPKAPEKQNYSQWQLVTSVYVAVLQVSCGNDGQEKNENFTFLVSPCQCKLLEGWKVRIIVSVEKTLFAR